MDRQAAGGLPTSAAVDSPGRLYQGVKLMILFRLMLPFFVIFGILYCTQIPWHHGIMHTLSLFLMALTAFSVVSFMIRDYPFSKKREKGERIQRFTFLFFIIPVFVITLLIQLFAYKHIYLWWALQGGILLLFCVFEYLAVEHLNRVLKTKEFLA